MTRAPTLDPWTTVDLPELAVDHKADELRAKGLSDSLVARARRRLESGAVDQIDLDAWVVAGDERLGDTRPEYRVTFETGRYHCTCYDHLYGDVRQARLCSHVLAVQLWRARHRIPPPTARMFADAEPWPEWVREFRPGQWRAAVETVRHFRAGKKVVITEAPTGFGKTLYGEMVRRMLGERALYLCTTKSLQDQFARDFPYGRVLKGRSNYPTLNYPERFGPPDWLSAADCDKEAVEDELTGERRYVCTWCDPVSACPYEQAKAAAMRARLAVSNVAYYLAEVNRVGRMEAFEFVIIDEADQLESELMRFIEVTVPARWQRELRLGRPERVTMPEAWERWIERALPRVQEALAELPERPTQLQQARDRRSLARLQQDLERVRGHLADGTWVYVGTEEPTDDGEGFRIAFKPVTVRDYARDVLWSHAKRFLLMSATIVSAQQMAEDLGLQPDEWAAVTADSTFPPERRPIYVLARADLSHDTEPAQWPTARECVDEILDRYAGYRVLVHTVSYRRAERLLRESRHASRMLTYRTAQERSEAIERFRQTPGAVLVAPSLERGVDLPNDACRAIIILKVPYPDYGDRQVRARLKLPGGRGWYLVQTVRSMVQMTGRGMRHKDDWCDSYIVDRQFVELWRRHRDLFPRWWRDAVWFGDKKTPVGAQDGGV